MSKKYQNGNTPKLIYADGKLTNKIGSLDPLEVARIYGKKTGFVI